MCVGRQSAVSITPMFSSIWATTNEIICPYCSTLYRYAADLADRRGPPARMRGERQGPPLIERWPLSRTIFVAGGREIGGLTASLALAGTRLFASSFSKKSRTPRGRPAPALQLSPQCQVACWSSSDCSHGLGASRGHARCHQPDERAKSGGEVVRLPLGEAANVFRARCGPTGWCNRADLQRAAAGPGQMTIPIIEIAAGLPVRRRGRPCQGTDRRPAAAAMGAAAGIGRWRWSVPTEIWSAVRHPSVSEGAAAIPPELIAWRGTLRSHPSCPANIPSRPRPALDGTEGAPCHLSDLGRARDQRRRHSAGGRGTDRDGVPPARARKIKKAFEKRWPGAARE